MSDHVQHSVKISLKVDYLGCRLALLVEWASHVQSICPHGSGPGFHSRPGALCCASLPLSSILCPVTSSADLLLKSHKKKQKHKVSYLCGGVVVYDLFNTLYYVA